MGELKLICQQLDRIIADYFVTQDELFQKQAKLENVMKEGMLGLAKARYSMGAKSVSTLQVNTEDMKALHMVQLKPQDPVIDIDDPYMTLTMVENDSPTDPDKTQDEGLRRRNVTEKEKQDTDDEKLDELISRVEDIDLNKAKMSSKKNDPLKWFGVLVPQALRMAQERFKMAAALSCETASLKNKMAHLQAAIRRLLRRKEDIISSIDDSGFVIYDDSSFSTSVNAEGLSPDVSQST